MIQNLNFTTSKNNILAFRVSGELDEVSFKQTTAQVLGKLGSEDHFNLYLEIDALKGLEFQVIWDSIKLAITNLGDYLKKVDKIAVVTDIEWFKTATRIEDKLIPSIDEKVFTSKQKDEAVKWLEY